MDSTATYRAVPRLTTTFRRCCISHCARVSHRWNLKRFVRIVSTGQALPSAGDFVPSNYYSPITHRLNNRVLSGLRHHCHESPLCNTVIVTGTLGAAIRGPIEPPAVVGKRTLTSHRRTPPSTYSFTYFYNPK